METPPGLPHTPHYRNAAQTSAVDTPASPSPRHSTPPEGHSFHDTPAAPIAKPQFRTLPDGEIILEEAAVPSPLHAADAVAGGPESPTARPQQQLQQQQQHLPPPFGPAVAPNAAGGRDLPKPPSKQRDLVVIASRSTTVQAQPSQKRSTMPSAVAEAAAAAAMGASNGGEARLHHHPHHHPYEGGGPDDETGGSNEPTSRMRYRPTLTQENVQHLTKLEQYSARPDPTERIWRWLEDAGPPYEGSPSVGVPSKAVPGPDTAAAAASKSSKRLWCFGCFGGDG